jgi:hypothetical protein
MHDGGGEGGEHCKRCNAHHVSGHAQYDIARLFDDPDQIMGLLAEGGRGRAEEL